jgi:uncharacterized membrane protein YhaH (DUF805 family)
VIKYWKEGFQKYAVFQGRATRAQYWSWVFVNLLIAIFGVVTLIFSFLIEPLFITILVVLVLYWLAIFIPDLAYTVRRLHDANLTGWLMLIYFVPYVGGLILFILTLLPSQNINNKYGPHPLTGQWAFVPSGYYPPYPPGTPPYSLPPYPPQGSYFPAYGLPPGYYPPYPPGTPPYSLPPYPPQGPPTQPGSQQVNPYQSSPFSPQQNYPRPQSPQPSPQPNFPSYPLNPEVPPPNNPTNPENQSDQP